MTTIHFFDMTIDMTEIFLLLPVISLGFLTTARIKIIESGTMARPIRVINQLILSIMIKTPTTRVTEVMICERL